MARLPGPQFATLMGTLAFGLRADDPPVFSDALEAVAALATFHHRALALRRAAHGGALQVRPASPPSPSIPRRDSPRPLLPSIRLHSRHATPGLTRRA